METKSCIVKCGSVPECPVRHRYRSGVIFLEVGVWILSPSRHASRDSVQNTTSSQISGNVFGLNVPIKLEI